MTTNNRRSRSSSILTNDIATKYFEDEKARTRKILKKKLSKLHKLKT